MDKRTTEQVKPLIEAQPILQPGEAGWWRVYGATPRDIRPGDYVMERDGEYLVQDTFIAKSVARVGIVVDGERITLGLLYPIVLLREGIKNTLSEYAR